MSADPDGLQRELRDEDVSRGLLAAIRKEAAGLRRVRLMEVCGTHTMAIRRYGLPALLPDNLELLSGPGCPVCVTPNEIIDRAIAMAADRRVILATFGDMLRVPGSRSSLILERARGAEVQVVYSPLDALKLARTLPGREVVFLGVGFETTAPTVGAAVEAARQLENFSVLVAHKLVPPALEALLARRDFAVDGFICPGHVSAIIGSDAYRNIASGHRVPCVVAGFEPADILLCILMLLRQLRSGRAEVEVEYRAVVHPQGNRRALELLRRVFVPADSEWRGIGVIPQSGLVLAPSFKNLDAARRFPVEIDPPWEPAGCRCGEVLVGAVRPPQCALYGKACTPVTPVGPCMVSSEGTCAAYFRYDLDSP